jgi:hypothetical protein
MIGARAGMTGTGTFQARCESLSIFAVSSRRVARSRRYADGGGNVQTRYNSRTRTSSILYANDGDVVERKHN